MKAAGLAVFKINAGALRFLVEKPRQDLEPDQIEDLNALATFVAKYGDSDIYELATF